MSNNWKIYTKKGDAGETSLIGGSRVLKSHIRIEAYGTVDELNSFVGWLRDSISNEPHRQALLKIQQTLFLLESYLAWEPGTQADHIPSFNEEEITFLENEIDQMESNLKPLTKFIIPGGHPHNSLCHVCRTVSRRAERIIIALNQEQEVQGFILKYINRLSDYFFVLARDLSRLQSAEEIEWVTDLDKR
jgi:cob(I)alamin adenosyltransferase